MTKILVIAEFDQNELKKSTRCTLNAAMLLGESIDLLLVGSNAAAHATEAASLDGVSRVLVNSHSCFDHFIAENLSWLILDLAPEYNFILAPATSFGKDFLPRVAAQLDVNQISDVIHIVDSNTFVRPIYAGNALATTQSQDQIKILTIRPSAFEPVTAREHAAAILQLQQFFSDERICFINQQNNPSERPSLENARVVIAGGRAFQNSENFQNLLEPLAKKLNAAIGASRAAVDADYAPNDYQIGQTGKVVAPELYMGIGISGALQHIAGMKESKVIVAINKDADAPLCQIANYTLIGDLFELLPELIEKL
jgi:electron transfer flavoprotein alpha subunit